MLSKKMMFGIAATLLLAGTAAAASLENSADATLAGANWRGRHFAPFAQEGSLVTGKYVEFTVDAANGALLDYTAKRNDSSRTIFTSVTVAGYDAEAAKSGLRGPLFMAGEPGDYGAAAFNARNAALFVLAKNATTVTYVVADGIEVEYHAGDPGWSRQGVLLREGEHTARIVVRGDAEVSVDGQTVTIALGEKSAAIFHLDGHPRELLVEKWILGKVMEKGKERRAAMRDG